jgi:tellurite methyltransferase
MDTHSTRFFEAQFQRQVAGKEFALNPFETLALEHLRGSVLDLGCGIGNLSLAAARRGHPVAAVDASPTAIQHVREQAQLEGLDVRAVQADLADFAPEGPYDTVVSIGLLMFFTRERALSLLEALLRAVAPGGRAIVNVLVKGTTYRAMFDPESHHLFQPGELERAFAGWRVLVSRRDSFPAPDGTGKEFLTVVAERPGAGP